MPKVSDAHRASRRDQILDAALACFAEKGFRGTSMTDVFEASGLSAGAVYSYFASKQELAVAVAKRTIGLQVGRILGDAETGPVIPPSRLLRSIAGGFAEVPLPTAIIVQLWGEAAVEPEFFQIAAEAFDTLRSSFLTVLTRWGREGRGMDAAAATAWAARVLPAMLALAQGYIIQSALLAGFDEDAYFAGAAAVLD
jgi:AcrR family transcriptional regulator